MPALPLLLLFLSLPASAGSKPDAQRLFDQGLRQYYRGDFDVALESFSQSIAQHPLGQAHALRAQVRRALGARESDIQSDLKRALSLGSSREPAVLVARGQARMLAGDLSGALADFDAALKEDPQYADARMGRGRVLKARGDHAAAALEFGQALQHDPELLIAHYHLALSLREAGKNPEAVEELVVALRRNPRFALAYGVLGSVLAARGDEKLALKAYSKGINLYPGYSYAYLGRAMLRAASGDWENALRDFDEAARAAPEDYAPYFNRGEVRYRRGEKAAALEDFSRALKLRVDYPPAAIAMGNRFLENERADEAVRMYGQAYEAAKGHPDPSLKSLAPEALALRARAFQASYQEPKALEDLSRAVELSPAPAAILVERGKLYQKMNKLAEAETDLRRALDIDRLHSPALIALGSLQAKRGLHEEAMKSFNQAIEINPTSAEAYNNRAVLSAGTLKDYDKALSDIEKALSLEPTNAGFQLNLAGIRLKRSEPRRAIEALNALVASKIAVERSLLLRSEAHALLGNAVMAHADLEEALAANPRSAAVLAALGNYHLRGREHTQALRRLNEALAIDKKNAKAFLYRGQVHARLGDLANALKDFQTSAENDKKPVEALASACQAQRLLGQSKAAINSCDRALQAEPDNAPALFQRGLAHLAAGDAAAAMRDLEKGTRLRPQSSALLALSVAYAAERQYKEADQAYREAAQLDPAVRSLDIPFVPEAAPKWTYPSRIQALEKALRKDSNDPYSYLVMGDGYLNARYYDKAMIEFTRAMEISGQLAHAYLNRGAALAAKNSREAAEADLRRAIELAPREMQAHLALIGLLTDQGRYDKAQAAVAAALRARPRPPAELYIRAGNLQSFLKKFDRAEEYYLAALKAEPDNAAAHNGLGLCLFAQGRYMDALDRFSRAIAGDPDYDRFYRNRAATYAGMKDFANARSDYRLAMSASRDQRTIREYQRLIQEVQGPDPSESEVAGKDENP